MTKNSAANLLRVGSSWIIIVFLPPLLVRVLDKQEYGVWLLLLQLAAYVTFFDGAIQMVIARYVSRLDGLSDRSQLAGLLSSASMVMLIACVLTVLLTGIFSLHLSLLFPAIPASIAPTASRAILILGISIALTLPFSVLAGFFLGRQKNGVTATAVSLGKFTGAAGSAWAAYHHRGMLLMATWIGLGYVLQSFIYLVCWKREDRHSLLLVCEVKLAVARRFLIFCSSMFVSQFSSLLITGMDMPVVAAFDFPSAAYYGVAAMLSNCLAVPHSAIVSSLLPVVSGISAGDDPSRLGQVLVKTTRFATAILCLITLPLLLLMPLLLRVWIGPAYATHTLLLGEILVIAQFIRLTMLPYAMIGFVAGQQHRMLVSPAVEATVNLLFSLALVQFMGARGVALGTLIGAVVGVWLHLTASFRKTTCVQANRRELIVEGIVKPLAFTAFSMLPAFLLLRMLSLRFNLILVAGAEMALFALLWRFSFEAAEHRQLRTVFFHFAARLGWAPSSL